MIAVSFTFQPFSIPMPMSFPSIFAQFQKQFLIKQVLLRTVSVSTWLGVLPVSVAIQKPQMDPQQWVVLRH